MTGEEYWQRRNIEREAAARKLSEQTIEKELSRLYRRSLRAIQKEIDALYGRFSAQNGVSIADARKIISSDEFQDWRMDIADYVSQIEETKDRKLLLELNTLAMRSRINRLDELHSVVLQEVDRLARRQKSSMDAFLGSQYKEGFLSTAFDIRQYLPNVPVHLSTDDVKKALRTPWSGKNYSERIWGNADKLASVLKQEVVNGLHRGTDVKTMARNVARRMDVSYKNAIRLVRTEHNYIQNKAHIDSIKDAGMKYFKFVATLDKKTSTECREHDGKIYSIDEVVQGLNAPPLHPHCRSVIVGSLKSYNYRKGKRIAKDANGGTIYVPGDMVYKDWEAVYINKTKTLKEWEDSRVNATIRKAYLQNYRKVGFDSSEKVTVNRGKLQLTLKRVNSARYNIFVSDSIRLKPRKLHEIEKNFTEALQMIGKLNSDKNLPVIYIVTTRELQKNAVASYFALSNIILINIDNVIDTEFLSEFAGPNKALSTYVHELIHWQQAKAFEKKFGAIDSVEKLNNYLFWIRVESKKKLETLEEKGYNLSQISRYAEISLRDGAFDEGYTEYLVKELFMHKGGGRS
ncbi:minor capsid protein [Veillonella magna]|uniref:minor capsid protein n=1 Tax=Veillonella magna TaxID=464322 RepID=UPI0023F43813|nr:minor capsid protein [Veillonella magna]